MCERRKRKHKEDFDPYSISQLNAVIDEWIKSERDRLILKLWLCDSYKFQQIADDERINLTMGQVQKICYRHENTIYKHLGLL